MISVECARQQAADMVGTGDPGRSIMIMTTPFRLACLNMHLSIYADATKDMTPHDELMAVLIDIQHDLQKVVVQILQQEYPST